MFLKQEADKKKNNQGFTLIELMIVVAIIGILAAIAIPNFLGMQEKAKRRSIEAGASASKSELHNWLNAALTTESGICDVDGDGIVTPTEGPVDQPNVVTSWIASFYAKKGGTVSSPWDPAVDLFAAATPVTGQIGLILTNSNRTILIIGRDGNGTTRFEDSSSAD